MPSDWLHRRPPERSSTSASSCEGTEYTTALLERLGTLGHKCVSNTCSLLRHGERKQSHPTSDSSPVTCELQLAVGSRFPLTPFGGLTGHQLINVSFLRRHRWTFALFRWAFPPKPLVSSAGSLFEGGGPDALAEAGCGAASGKALSHAQEPQGAGRDRVALTEGSADGFRERFR